jgi:hypothetical protein
MAAEMPATRLVYIADREGDIRALMDRAAELGHPADWLIRCLHNRTLDEGSKLWAVLEHRRPCCEVSKHGARAVHAASGRGT